MASYETDSSVSLPRFPRHRDYAALAAVARGTSNSNGLSRIERLREVAAIAKDEKGCAGSA